jgi:3-methylcrotonyl-CoA carboxylase alpha subunit
VFSRVLVANRGEIAVRVIRACREMGIGTVAVYSDADAGALHVLLADQAVRLGPPDPAESYLHIGRIIDAARAAGAQAVHPGYGFLAESAAFAAACGDAGLAFIGPPPEVIARLGDKTAARRLAAGAGVPVVPGFDGPRASDGAIRDAIARLGLPVLLKAASGGGGRGMRVVSRTGDLDALLSSARREAQAAFGDDAILVEKLIERPRHVEVQILADARGAVVHLGERECSIQRRHQKIVEESPSPAVDGALRDRLGQAALAVARAAGYVNAGTVEFLVDRDRRFYFLEVNTRLQVEHPVTEMTAGVDLVHEQLRIAAGAPLRLRQDDVALRGHAIECRIYAEDPEMDFAPSPGRVLHLHEPALPGVRVDSGIRTGWEIPIHYDPILSKVIAWAPDRPAALARMRRALSEYALLGPRTNLSFLAAVVAHPAFAAGDLSTDFLSEHLAGWRHPAPSPEVLAIAASLTGLISHLPGMSSRPSLSPPWDPWDRLTGWRGDGAGPGPSAQSLEPGVFAVQSGGRRLVVHAAADGRRLHLQIDGQTYVLEPGRSGARSAPGRPHHLDLAAPMPGIVTRIFVEVGRRVSAGDPLFAVEAMKMEHIVRAPADGEVTTIRAAAGTLVDAGAIVVEVHA